MFLYLHSVQHFVSYKHIGELLKYLETDTVVVIGAVVKSGDISDICLLLQYETTIPKDQIQAIVTQMAQFYKRHDICAYVNC